MEKIETFKNRLAKIENGTLPKNDAPMTTEDAIWNIEALMNFRYCQAQLPFENVENPKATLKIPLNSKGNVDNNALLVAVQTIKAMLSEQYHAVREVKKHFISIDLRAKVAKSLSRRYLTLDIVSSIGISSGNALLRGSNLSFGDWDARFQQGRCDGSYAPRWAGSELSEAINDRNGPANVNVYFTSVETFNIFSGTIGMRTPNDALDNYRDYLMYSNYVGYTNHETLRCMNQPEMNWYFDNLWDIIIPQFKPSGKSFIALTDYIQIGPPTIAIEHRASLAYGVKHNNYEEPPTVP